MLVLIKEPYISGQKFTFRIVTPLFHLLVFLNRTPYCDQLSFAFCRVRPQTVFFWIEILFLLIGVYFFWKIIIEIKQWRIFWIWIIIRFWRNTNKTWRSYCQQYVFHFIFIPSLYSLFLILLLLFFFIFMAGEPKIVLPFAVSFNLFIFSCIAQDFLLPQWIQ